MMCDADAPGGVTHTWGVSNKATTRTNRTHTTTIAKTKNEHQNGDKTRAPKLATITRATTKAMITLMTKTLGTNKKQ